MEVCARLKGRAASVIQRRYHFVAMQSNKFSLYLPAHRALDVF
jgi:hypothetical protein